MSGNRSTHGGGGGLSAGPTMVMLPPVTATSSCTDGIPSPSAPPARSISTPTNASTTPVNAHPGFNNNTNTISIATTSTANPSATTNTHTPGLLPNPSTSSRLSSNWDSDSSTSHCSACQRIFHPVFNRRHHCRLCGRLFCHDCSNTRSLIPPSALVLKAHGNGGMSMSGNGASGLGAPPSFASNADGDASVTYVSTNLSTTATGAVGGADDTLLYGRGLERRILLARHPQRTCHSCQQQLAPLQEELCCRNSNAMRYNYIDEGDALRRLCNSPLAFTLGHEVRKAAYTLGNLLPGNKGKRGGFMPTTTSSSTSSTLQYSYPPPESDPCHIPAGGGCKSIDPTLRNVDGMHIPAKLLQRAYGMAIITSAKGGLGFAGFEFGTGLVVARRRRRRQQQQSQHSIHNDNATASVASDVEDLDDWSAPSAIGIGGICWGALLGAQISDHVFLLMTEEAVRLFASEKGKSIQLGADIGVAVGPLGRSAEADIGATSGLSRSLVDNGGYHNGIAMAPIYTYSLSKGLYAGISLDGRIISTRDRVNEKFYGRAVSAHELLSGEVATPPAAQPLYDALKRCRVYGGGGTGDAVAAQRGGVTSSMMSGSDMAGGYNVHSVNSSSSNIGGASGGGFLERLSHTTGAGLPVASTGRSKYSSPNPYNLSGREDHY